MAQRGPAQSVSRLHRVELFLDRPAVDGNEARLAALLAGLPGVRSVVVVGRDPRTVEACLRVDFDPRRTGAAVMTAVLAVAGFAVVAAAERPGSRP